VNVHEELGVINHSAHPHIWGRKLYNMGQKLSLWLGPHYIIAELDGGKGRMDRTSRRPSSNINRSRSPSVITVNNTSATSSLDSSTTNLSTLLAVVEKEEDSSLLPSKYSRSPWAHAKIVATIPSRWPLSLCYMHTFSITQNYFVLVEQPLALFLPTVPLNQISGHKPFSSCLKFYPEEDTIFHVVSRHGKKSSTTTRGMSKSRKSFRSPSFFFLHTINAFEMRDSESTFVVVDICCYDDPSMIVCMYVDALKVSHSFNYSKKKLYTIIFSF
jgi:hypothetical protein